LEGEDNVILDQIIAHKREEVADAKRRRPAGELKEALSRAPSPRDFERAICRGEGGTIRLIAEFKRASPSKGVIRPDLDPASVARRYAAGGASAISVLTDRKFFSGALEDIESVRAAVELPLLRKDFMIDSYQVIEARAAGADAILLIAAALELSEMADLRDAAAELGMASLVEVHNERELEKALAISPGIIGVNNRDLRTFEVDFETTLRLRPLIPEGILVVSESGIRDREDVRRLQEAGVDAILVGESLMRQPDPGRAAAELLGQDLP
jgi:indole-3-glycerol phosphate synthase